MTGKSSKSWTGSLERMMDSSTTSGVAEPFILITPTMWGKREATPLSYPYSTLVRDPGLILVELLKDYLARAIGAIRAGPETEPGLFPARVVPILDVILLAHRELVTMPGEIAKGETQGIGVSRRIDDELPALR